jgi:iron complex transport system ATP-binding protein
MTRELGHPLRDDFDRVAAVVPYLRAECGAPDGGEWLSCADLCSDHAFLRHTIMSTGGGRGTDDGTVAASLFAQAYAFRVAGVALAAYVLERRVPDVGAEQLAVGMARSRPSAVAFLRPRRAGLAADPAPCDVPLDNERELLAWFVRQLVGAHLRPFVDTVREVVDVGERLLWGNAAASCAVALRAVEGAVADPLPVRADAEAFFAAVPEFEGLGGFVVLEQGERQGWFYERTSCCLYYRSQAGITCDDCSRTPAVARRAAFCASLAVPS